MVDKVTKDEPEVISLWERFIFPRLSSVTDTSIREQIYFFGVYSLLGLLTVTTFGLLHIWQGSYFVGQLELAGGIIMFANVIGLRFTRNIDIARALLLLTILCLLIIMLTTGGIQRTGIYWYFAFPIAAFFLSGKKGGSAWVASLYLATFVVLFLYSMGVASISYSFFEIRQLLISLFVFTSGIYLYQSVRERAAQASDESSEIYVIFWIICLLLLQRLIQTELLFLPIEQPYRHLVMDLI